MRGVCNQPLLATIHLQVELFQHRLADHYLITKDQRLIQSLAAHDIHRDAV